MTADTLAAVAKQYADEAAALERGEEFDQRLWNHDHWLIYETIAPTEDAIREARWISDALTDPPLGDRFLALMPKTELDEIRKRIEQATPNRKD
jgi:hypothetical protein